MSSDPFHAFFTTVALGSVAVLGARVCLERYSAADDKDQTVRLALWMVSLSLCVIATMIAVFTAFWLGVIKPMLFMGELILTTSPAIIAAVAFVTVVIGLLARRSIEKIFTPTQPLPAWRDETADRS